MNRASQTPSSTLEVIADISWHWGGGDCFWYYPGIRYPGKLPRQLPTAQMVTGLPSDVQRKGIRRGGDMDPLQ